jgi:signal peptidase I
MKPVRWSIISLTTLMEQPQQLKSFIRDIVTILVIAGVLILGLQAVVQKFVVEGPSMNDTLHNGQQLMVNKIVYSLQEPKRGDIIVFHPPIEIDEDDYIKRIIGLPGEKVVIVEGKVYIHKMDSSTIELDEPYVTNPALRDFEGKVIPEGEYFVMGDNRNNSSDSRVGWTLKREDIIGKAWIAIWPPSDWGLIANHDFHEKDG